MNIQCFGADHSNGDTPNNVRLPLTSGIVGSGTIEMPDPENMKLVF